MLAIQSGIAKHHIAYSQRAVALQTPGVFFYSHGRGQQWTFEEIRAKNCTFYTNCVLQMQGDIEKLVMMMQLFDYYCMVLFAVCLPVYQKTVTSFHC